MRNRYAGGSSRRSVMRAVPRNRLSTLPQSLRQRTTDVTSATIVSLRRVAVARYPVGGEVDGVKVVP
jgi:hypothetical protein